MNYIDYTKVYSYVRTSTRLPNSLEDLTDYFKYEERYECGWLICDQIINLHFRKNGSSLKFKINVKECELGYLLVDTVNKKISEFEKMIKIATKIVITKRDLLNPISQEIINFLKYNNKTYFVDITEDMGGFVSYYIDNKNRKIGSSATVDHINNVAYEFLNKHAEFIDINLSVRKDLLK